LIPYFTPFKSINRWNLIIQELGDDKYKINDIGLGSYITPQDDMMDLYSSVMYNDHGEVEDSRLWLDYNMGHKLTTPFLFVDTKPLSLNNPNPRTFSHKPRSAQLLNTPKHHPDLAEDRDDKRVNKLKGLLLFCVKKKWLVKLLR
jgi:hypothetical protein